MTDRPRHFGVKNGLKRFTLPFPVSFNSEVALLISKHLAFFTRKQGEQAVPQHHVLLPERELINVHLGLILELFLYLKLFFVISM